MREVQEKLWARDEEVRLLRDKLEGLRKTLDERRADITSYKVCVCGGGGGADISSYKGGRAVVVGGHGG